MQSHSITVERTINAPAARIFALLADAGNHQKFDGSGTLRGTQTPSQPLNLGTTFGMSMHAGMSYKTSNTVIEFEQDQLIAWQTTGLGGLIGGRIWRYELEPTSDGTLVRETWDISSDKQRVFLRRGKLPGRTKAAMQSTLDRIAEQLAA